VINNVTTFQGFRTNGFVLVDALLGHDLGETSPGLKGWEAAVNAANLFDKRHISACPFNNSCYFGAARTITASLRYSLIGADDGRRLHRQRRHGAALVSPSLDRVCRPPTRGVATRRQ
jgi:hypothetical protein